MERFKRKKKLAMIGLILFGIGCVFLLGLFLKQLKKFKTNAFHINVFEKNDKASFFISIEWEHGKYIDTRKLPNFYLACIPKELAALLLTTFEREEQAYEALKTYQSKIKNTGILRRVL